MIHTEARHSVCSCGLPPATTSLHRGGMAAPPYVNWGQKRPTCTGNQHDEEQMKPQKGTGRETVPHLQEMCEQPDTGIRAEEPRNEMEELDEFEKCSHAGLSCRFGRGRSRSHSSPCPTSRRWRQALRIGFDLGFRAV